MINIGLCKVLHVVSTGERERTGSLYANDFGKSNK